MILHPLAPSRPNASSRPQRRPFSRSLALVAAAVTVLWTALLEPPTARAQCGDNEPAFPVPQCRDQTTGAPATCGTPGAVRLWPGVLRPGKPGQQLPARRDSTQWRSHVPPDINTGLELFQSLDVVGDKLYVAYNVGIQMWDLSGNNAEDPLRASARDGWDGDFASFPNDGENHLFVRDIDAIDPSAAGLGNLVGVAAEDGVGTNFWVDTGFTLEQLYQDLERPGTGQIRVVEVGGTVYALAAGGGTEGVWVYNVSAAANLPQTPCLEPDMACDGVFLGAFGTATNAAYLDVLLHGGRVFVAIGRDVGLPAEIWELVDPDDPTSAVRRFSGISGGVQGIALFTHGADVYLGAVERRPGFVWEVHIYRATGCVTGSGACTIQEMPWSYRPAQVGQDRFLTFSRSQGVPYLYYGVQSNNLFGSAVEGLFDLSTLGASNQITEITAGGNSYTDACNGETVDYWGDYYATNDHGLRNVRPRVGKFGGIYFYRAAFGILDVHVITVPVPNLTVFGPPEGCPGEPAEFLVTADSCSPNPPTSPYAWTASGGGSITGNGSSSVEVTWTNPGLQTVSVSNPDCGGATGSAAIQIQDPSALAFTSAPTYTGAPNPQGEGRAIAFSAGTDGAIEWEWNWGDGSPPEVFTDEALGESPSHTFATPGTYTVVVTIKSCTGTELTAQVMIEIIDNPLEVITFRAQCPLGFCDFCIGSTVTFQQNFGGDPTSFSYDWDGDGTFDQTTSVAVPSHVYTSARTAFLPRIRISANGQTAERTHVQPLNVSDCSPTSVTVSGPDSLETGESGNFLAAASGCSPAVDGWSWNADGGEIVGSSNTQQVAVLWNTPGTKNLVASNINCGSTTGTKTVSVTAPPDPVVASFSFSPASPETGMAVTFDGTSSTGPITSYDWTFGDGSTGSGAVVDHTYLAAGAYPVTLTVSGNGDTDTATLTVTVTAPPEAPVASFTFTPASPETGTIVTFDGTGSTGPITAYDWTFGDGSTAGGAVVQHGYGVAGTYPVTLTVTGDGGTDSQTQNVTVTAPAEPFDMLILPYYEVDTTDPNALTTFYSVHNDSDTTVRVQYSYFDAGEEEFPFVVENLLLAPQRTRVVNVGNLVEPPVGGDGIARGWVLITVIEPLLGERVLGGDYFRLDRANDFASGANLLTTQAPDLCSRWRTRFFNGGTFDGGTDISFYAPSNPGGETPVATGTVYDENGNFIRTLEIRSSEVAFEINSQDLDLGTDFGAVNWQFADGVLGHVAAILKASGKFSVGLPSVCRDQEP